MEFHEVLRHRRLELGISQAALANAAGVDRRQIRRYEHGEAQPALNVAVALAEELDLSVSELAGIPSQTVGVDGRWSFAWQAFRGGDEVILIREVNMHHERDVIQMHSLTRSTTGMGGNLWSSELRMWDQKILMGWYGAADGIARSKGTLYLVLDRHKQQMTGRWTGLSVDSDLESGLMAAAKTEKDATDRLDSLRATKNVGSLHKA